MARHRRKKISLYEAMTQTRHKRSPADYDRAVGRLHPDKAGENTTSEEKSDVQVPISGLSAKWWRRPRQLQFNASRIEFSISYPIAIAIVLGIILLVLLAFRVGQYYSIASEQPAGDNPAGNVSGPLLEEAGRLNSSKMQDAGVSQNLPLVEKKVELAKPKGDNAIVLVEYARRADLVPVQRHFAQFGIETDIVNWGGKYFLITKDLFEGFSTGSDGYEAKQKIVEVGALYKGKAPEGYETFAPRFFRDAYGKKVK